MHLTPQGKHLVLLFYENRVAAVQLTHHLERELAGVQFDDHVFHVSKFTTMRVAAAVDFPRSFPLQQGEQPFGLRVTRLGVKSKIF